MTEHPPVTGVPTPPPGSSPAPASCWRCRYDLSSHPAPPPVTCPECGQADATRTDDHAHDSRRIITVVLVSFLCTVFSFVLVAFSPTFLTSLFVIGTGFDLLAIGLALGACRTAMSIPRTARLSRGLALTLPLLALFAAVGWLALVLAMMFR